MQAGDTGRNKKKTKKQHFSVMLYVCVTSQLVSPGGVYESADMRHFLRLPVRFDRRLAPRAGDAIPPRGERVAATPTQWGCGKFPVVKHGFVRVFASVSQV